MGSCISNSKKQSLSSSNRRRQRSQHGNHNTNNINNSIGNSNNNILNSSFDNEINNQNNNNVLNKSKNLNNNKKKKKKFNSCVKCSNNNDNNNNNRSSSNSSISSSIRSINQHQQNSTRRINNQNNNYHDNNNLDLDFESTDEDEDFELMNNYNQFNRIPNEIVGDIINAIRAVVINNHGDEPPSIIIEMQRLASDEKGWIKIMIELINRIELDDPIGPPIISLFLDEFPIPTPDSIQLLLKKMPTTKPNVPKNKERNCFVIFSCLGEKVAGPSSASLMNNDTLEFTFSKLKYNEQFDNKENFTKSEIEILTVMLYAIIALEKFAISTENRLKIIEKFQNKNNPLLELSKWNNEKHYLKRQIGFNSLFLLDNAFPSIEHKFGYETVNILNINAKLNDNDVSEYLKLSPNGLEARNDTLSFESVRCTFQCDTDCWYYEVTILTNGIMQIGFATKQSKFLNYNGYGIGDDEYSVAYDGCRRFIWYNADPHQHEHKAWREGDVVGLLLDLNNYKIIFYLNGEPLQKPHTKIFESAKTGFFAAASFMSFQHCVFNFGREEFKYPPKNYNFKKFNDYGVLTDEERIILPRKKKLDLLRESTISDGACTLCCDSLATVILLPCNHTDYCNNCANRLTTCPICRSTITSIKNIKN